MKINQIKKNFRIALLANKHIPLSEDIPKHIGFSVITATNGGLLSARVYHWKTHYKISFSCALCVLKGLNGFNQITCFLMPQIQQKINKT